MTCLSPHAIIPYIPDAPAGKTPELMDILSGFRTQTCPAAIPCSGDAP